MSGRDQIDALMELARAAHAIGAQPTLKHRQVLWSAVARVARFARLRGLSEVPMLDQAEAVETFRVAVRLAREAGVPHLQLVGIFNKEEEPAPAGRKDFQ